MYFRVNWNSPSFGVFMSSCPTFWLQTGLELILWVICSGSKYFKVSSRPALFSAYPIKTLRSVKLKLNLRKRAKGKIYIFRANWDSRKSLYIFSKNFQTRIQIFWRKWLQEWFNLIIWSPKKLSRVLHAVYHLRRALWKSTKIFLNFAFTLAYFQKVAVF